MNKYGNSIQVVIYNFEDVVNILFRLNGISSISLKKSIGILLDLPPYILSSRSISVYEITFNSLPEIFPIYTLAESSEILTHS